MGHTRSCKSKSILRENAKRKEGFLNPRPSQTSINGMPYLLNKHPEVFSDPDSFRPERWLEASARGEHLEKYLVTFTKGSRICLGLK